MTRFAIVVVDLLAEKDDALAEQARVDVERPFQTPVRLDDHREPEPSRLLAR